MTITRAQILRAVPTAERKNLDEFVSTFNKWADSFGLNTPLRIVHFLAQVFHESGNLKYMEENLNYSASGLLKTFPKYFTKATASAYARKPEKIANRVYADRMGNGNEVSGDGWKFRGRGLVQLTGKDNYKAYARSKHCVGDLMSHPEWLCKYPGALKSAMWYWQEHGLNELADQDNVEAVTRKVNGGFNGLADRMFLYRRFKKEIN